ncbi:putative transcription factor interactor and regulator CCHC(Zn) family [Helianthus anomalus]
MELIDIKWCMESVIRRAHDSWRSLEGVFICFKCKEKGHFKRECTNREVNDNRNHFGSDYYKKVIYHKNSQHPPNMLRQIQIEDGSSKSNDKALVMTQEDEGFNWNNLIPKIKSLALMAEIR